MNPVSTKLVNRLIGHMSRSARSLPAVSPREVKENFVLAERMKPVPLLSQAWDSAIERVKGEISKLSDSMLDALVTDPKRLSQINRSKWVLGKVELSRCTIWPKMGGWFWAVGTVTEVGIKCIRRLEPNDLLWQKAKRYGIIKTIPIIAHMSSPHGHCRIDCGSEQAVAMFLAGAKAAPAYIGQVPNELQHSW